MSSILKFTFIIIAFTLFIYSSILIMENISNFIFWLITTLSQPKKVKEVQAIEEKFTYRAPLIERTYISFKLLMQKYLFKAFFYSLIALILILLIHDRKMFDIRFTFAYVIILIFSIVNLISKWAIATVKRGDNFDFILNAGLTVVYFVLIIISVMASVLSNIKPNKELNFPTICIVLIFILVPLYSFAIACLNKGVRTANIIIVFIVFALFEFTLYSIFGIYNATTDPNLMAYVNIDNMALMLLRLLQIGASFVFSYPGVYCKLEYFLQFIIGFFINVLIIGFFVSYISSKVVQCSNCNAGGKVRNL